MDERHGGYPGLYVRLFRIALRLYPKSFRESYGQQMTRDFAWRLDHQASRGTGPRLSYATRSIFGIVPSALRVRVEAAVGAGSDLRAAARALRRAPGFALLSASLLALGVAGSAIIFSVLYGVLLRPLPYERADRIAVVWTFNERQRLIDGSSYPNMADWQARARSIEEWAFWYRPDFTARTLLSNDVPLRIEAGAVSASFFSVLGIEPVIGRVFTEQEERNQFAGIVISNALWQSRFAGARNVLGKTLIVDGTAREIIGVMPPEFQLPRPGTMLWELHSVLTGWPNLGPRWGRRGDSFVAIGRLASGSTIEEAGAELDAIAADLQREYPNENRDLGVRTTSLISELTGEDIPKTLWLLQTAALLVLLAVAANVGQLWAVRALGRRRELGVRLALGSGRGRLVRTLFAEGMLITGLGTALGVLFAGLTLDPLLLLAPADLPRMSEVALDPTVVLLIIAAALAIGGSASLLSAWLASRASPVSVISNGARTVGGTARSRGRSALVILQVAVASVLLAGTGLFLRSFQNLERVDIGMETRGTLVARVEVPMARYPTTDEVMAFHAAVLDALRAAPGVESAGAISDFLFRRFPDSRIVPEGKEGEDYEVTTPLMVDFVTPGLVDAAGMRVVRGRDLAPTDDWVPGDPTNVLVNQTFARAFWPGQDAVGKRFQWGSYDPQNPWHTVVGILADTRRGGLDQRPIAQAFGIGPAWNVSYVARTASDAPLALAPAVRAAVHTVDPAIAISWIAPADELLGRGLTLWRLRPLMALLAAALVVTLAMLGMYGLLNETVLRRRHEIGLRIAIGALPASVRNKLIARGVALAATGFAIGVLGLAAFARVVRAFLFEVAPLDLANLGSIGMLVVVLAAVTSAIPARRVTRIDPARLLTVE